MAVRTLEQVLRVAHPRELSFNAFAKEPHRLRLPDRGMAVKEAFLKDPVAWTRNDTARRALASLAPRDAGSVLLELVHQGGNLYAAAAAAEALGRMHDPRALQVLTEMSQRGPDWMRRRALTALGEFQDPSIEGFATSMLSDPSPTIRAAAVAVLGRVKSPATMQRLLPLLRDPAPEARLAALRAIAGLAEPSAFDALAPLTDDPDPFVADLAWQALTDIPGSAATGKRIALEAEARRKIVAAWQARMGQPHWRTVFRRSTLGRDAYHVRSHAFEPYLLDFCHRLGVPRHGWSNMFSPSYESADFLGGGVVDIIPYGFGGGARGTYVIGFEVLRYVCRAFGIAITQRVLRGEQSIRQADEVDHELDGERRSPPPPPTAMSVPLLSRLARPTPPAMPPIAPTQPLDPTEQDGYCLRCRRWVAIKNPQQLTMKNGKSAITGPCAQCGTKVFKIGGGA